MWAHHRCHPVTIDWPCTSLWDNRYQNKWQLLQDEALKWWNLVSGVTVNYDLFYPTPTDHQPFFFKFPFFLGNLSLCICLLSCLYPCRKRSGATGDTPIFLLLPLFPYLYPSSLFPSLPISLWYFNLVFLFCREQYWFYTPGNERIQLGEEFSGSESLLFPVVLFVFFTSLLAAHKSARLLINGTARCHIFPL